MAMRISKALSLSSLRVRVHTVSATKGFRGSDPGKIWDFRHFEHLGIAFLNILLREIDLEIMVKFRGN